MKQIETITQTNQYDEFIIDSVTINLSDSAIYCKVAYYLKGEDCLDGGIINLSAYEVATWGESDDILYQIVAGKLGLTLKGGTNIESNLQFSE